jgi:serine/threonine-protein kinase
VQLVAAVFVAAAARGRFEKAFSESSRPTTRPPPLTGPATAAAASRFALEVLERAERRLAEHIGGVARVLVKRAALKARTEAELYVLLGEEIEDQEERKAFIRRGVAIPGKR